jgi:hypothetical protein
MKPIFVRRGASIGETRYWCHGTGVHESPLLSATVNSLVQCGIFRCHLGPYFFASTKRNSYRKRRALSTRARQFMITSNTPFMHSERKCSCNMLPHPIQLEFPRICYETSFQEKSFSAADTSFGLHYGPEGTPASFCKGMLQVRVYWARSATSVILETIIREDSDSVSQEEARQGNVQGTFSWRR